MKKNIINANKVIIPPEDLLWVTNFEENDAKAFTTGVMKIANRDEREPVVVYVDSYGGYVDVLASMLSTMDGVPNPFITIASGKAMSCGAILLAHGNIRCVGVHARVMIHRLSGAAMGNIKDVQQEAAELTRVSDHFDGVLAKDCGKSLKQLRAVWKDHREIYFTPKQAVKFGLADRVGVPNIDRYSAFTINFTKV